MNRRSNIGFALAVLLWIAGTGPAWALHPLITEDAYTLGEGTSQLEIGIEHNRLRRDPATERINLLRPVFSHGLRENLDVLLGLPMAQVREEFPGGLEHRHGIGDATLDLKWRVWEGEAAKLALKPSVSLATGDVDRGFGGGRVAAGAALVATFEREGWNWNLHGGYLWNNNEAGSRQNLWHLSGSVLIQVREGLQLALDASMDSRLEPSEGNWLAVLLGALIYSARKDLDLDLGVKVGLNEPGDDYGVVAGVTFRW